MVPGYDSKHSSNGKKRYNYVEPVLASNYERLSNESIDRSSTLIFLSFEGSNACSTVRENVSFIERIVLKKTKDVGFQFLTAVVMNFAIF
jgi:hypothetical protein